MDNLFLLAKLLEPEPEQKLKVSTWKSSNESFESCLSSALSPSPGSIQSSRSSYVLCLFLYSQLLVSLTDLGGSIMLLGRACKDYR